MTTKPRVAAGASPPTALPRADISLSAIPSALWKLKRWPHELESEFYHLAAGLYLLASSSNLLRQQANRPAPRPLNLDSGKGTSDPRTSELAVTSQSNDEAPAARSTS